MKATLQLSEKKINATIDLPASKSISNRLLIIRELADKKFDIRNLSSADDTQLLNEILNHPSAIEDCGHGGTTLRFLLALRALQNSEVILTGSDRLKERPLALLVNSLNESGANICYSEKEGFAPVKISGGNLTGGKIKIDSSVSSQFISALMMIAPKLKDGLTIQLTSEIVSKPYILLTASLMKQFNVDVIFEEDKILIPESSYSGHDFNCTPDWSAAAFFYGFAACKSGTSFRLKNLAEDLYQGDSVLKELMKNFDVNSVIDGKDILIHSENLSDKKELLQIDFTDHPDLAQALTVVAAVRGISCYFTGLSTLRDKEADRLSALKTELEKTGVKITITKDSLRTNGKADPLLIDAAEFHTYKDHRMSMALSILAAMGTSVKILDPFVVNKSFPGYFDQLSAAGFDVKVTC